MEIITFIAVSPQAKFLEKLGAILPVLFLTGSSTAAALWPFLTIKTALEEAIIDLVTTLCVSNSATPQNAAHQAPLSMGFPRQEY